jgi:hypothetical protein
VGNMCLFESRRVSEGGAGRNKETKVTFCCTMDHSQDQRALQIQNKWSLPMP